MGVPPGPLQRTNPKISAKWPKSLNILSALACVAVLLCATARYWAFGVRNSTESLGCGPEQKIRGPPRWAECCKSCIIGHPQNPGARIVS